MKFSSHELLSPSSNCCRRKILQRPILIARIVLWLSALLRMSENVKCTRYQSRRFSWSRRTAVKWTSNFVESLMSLTQSTAFQMAKSINQSILWKPVFLSFLEIYEDSNVEERGSEETERVRRKPGASGTFNWFHGREKTASRSVWKRHFDYMWELMFTCCSEVNKKNCALLCSQ